MCCALICIIGLHQMCINMGEQFLPLMIEGMAMVGGISVEDFMMVTHGQIERSRVSRAMLVMGGSQKHNFGIIQEETLGGVDRRIGGQVHQANTVSQLLADDMYNVIIPQATRGEIGVQNNRTTEET